MEAGKSGGSAMEEEAKISFFCRHKVMVEVDIEVAVWGWRTFGPRNEKQIQKKVKPKSHVKYIWFLKDALIAINSVKIIYRFLHTQNWQSRSNVC